VPEWLSDLAKRIAGRDSNLRTLLPQSLSLAARRRVAGLRVAGVKLAPDGRENRWRLMTSPQITERAEVGAHIGARHGVAIAFPLLDRRVVEFLLSLPSELFLRGGFRRRTFCRKLCAGGTKSTVRSRAACSILPIARMSSLRGSTALQETIAFAAIGCVCGDRGQFFPE
jgi:asparagine synthase